MTSKAIWRDKAKAWQAMCESWIIFENNASNKYLQSRRWSAAWKRAAKENHKRVWKFMYITEGVKESSEAVRLLLIEARSIARRLLRERDETTLLLTDCQDRVDRYFAKITSLKSHVSKVEAERDALAKQCDELRGVLEQVEWFSYYDLSTTCPWCNGKGTHEPDCIRQKALGKA